jgi:hypothetical protein
MKVSDIEAALKRTGGILLKDGSPETYQAELSAGPSTVFLSRTSPTSAQKDSILDSTESRRRPSSKTRRFFWQLRIIRDLPTRKQR